MHFQFLLSGPQSDIELSQEDLDQPFLLSPGEQHPFLTLADYFQALESFVLFDDGRLILAALRKQPLWADTSLADISRVLIRSEKHGAYNHIASFEIIALGKNIKLACTAALSEYAKTALAEEYIILKQLFNIKADYIPASYCKQRITCKTGGGTAEFLMVLGEWLEGYHEWHASDDSGAGCHKIHLWDYENGYRFLTEAESSELLSQAAAILTCYYDQENFRQIYPWHHGAGDFIVRCGSPCLSVKLITARQYEPLVHFDRPGEADRLVAAIHFLLNLCLRMRLDRLDGVGDPVWLEKFALAAAVAGFFSGLVATEAGNRLLVGPVTEFLQIMQSFAAREIHEMYESLLEIYAEEDREDFGLIREKLSDHAAALHDTLQSFSL